MNDFANTCVKAVKDEAIKARIGESEIVRELNQNVEKFKEDLRRKNEELRIEWETFELALDNSEKWHKTHLSEQLVLKDKEISELKSLLKDKEIESLNLWLQELETKFEAQIQVSK
ncbi:MAG: hypothetical protein GBAus27B_000561 [Mycoplasmataceae bacterium]|nr:MAG: hypothetical protein GBAus27B_000561 [Mycoplasmataceae bacterium]